MGSNPCYLLKSFLLYSCKKPSRISKGVFPLGHHWRSTVKIWLKKKTKKKILTCNFSRTSLEQPISSFDEWEDWEWLAGGGIRKFEDAKVTRGGPAAWPGPATWPEAEADAAAIWRAKPELLLAWLEKLLAPLLLALYSAACCLCNERSSGWSWLFLAKYCRIQFWISCSWSSRSFWLRCLNSSSKFL